MRHLGPLIQTPHSVKKLYKFISDEVGTGVLVIEEWRKDTRRGVVFIDASLPKLLHFSAVSPQTFENVTL